jgi:glyoxylate reductase
MQASSRVFVTRSLEGLGVPDVLAPVRAGADCEVWREATPPPPGELRSRLAGCRGLFCLLTDRIDAALIESCPELRVISSMSVGVDHIDVAAASRSGIAVGHTPGVLTETTADLSFALMLAAARRIAEADGFVRQGSWTPERRWEPDMLLGRDLHGATLGVVGLGAIGQAVARRARGFGMRVLGWTRSGRSVPGVETAEFGRLLAESDFVSLHVALAPETRGLFDARAIAAMKPGAILVNSARGGIVDEQALARALKSGALAGAALDVFEGEPLSPESPLLELRNVVLAPHIGSGSIATRRRMAELAVRNLLAGLEGRPLPHCVNAG